MILVSSPKYEEAMYELRELKDIAQHAEMEDNWVENSFIIDRLNLIARLLQPATDLTCSDSDFKSDKYA